MITNEGGAIIEAVGKQLKAERDATNEQQENLLAKFRELELLIARQAGQIDALTALREQRQ